MFWDILFYGIIIVGAILMINHYRAISGQTPIGLDGKPKDGKNKKKKK